jgi:excisionase family DNA binding protein
VPDAPVWLNTDAAAAYIGITPSTLRRLVDRGEVVAFQIGRVRRYRQEDLDRFLEHARVEPAT